MEQQFTIQDIIDGAIENEPTKVQSAFDHLIGPKIMDALEARKREIANLMYAPENEVETQTDEIEEEDENTAPVADQN